MARLGMLVVAKKKVDSLRKGIFQDLLLIPLLSRCVLTKRSRMGLDGIIDASCQDGKEERA